MRKKVALTLVFIFMATVLFPFQALAAYDRELEQAITTAKTLFKISDGYDNFSYNINKNNDRTVFDLMWNDSKNRLGNINVTVDSAGKVLNYYSYKPYDGRNRKKLPSVSKSDARKTADSFIQRVHPAAWKNLQYQENNYPMNINERNYYFYYVRVENGVPYPENGVNISVDAMTGEVQSFNYNWREDVTFPDAAGAMGLAEAQQNYAGKLGLKLLYKLSYDQNEQQPYLVYTSVYSNRFIDAKTGDVVTGGDYYGFGYYGGAMEKQMAMGGMGNHSYADQKAEPLTPKEQEAVKNAADLMDQDKAEETARKALNIGSDFKLNYVSLYGSWRNRGDYIWNMEFGREDKSGGETRYFNISAGIDARTGDILHFYRYVPHDPNAPVKYSGEQSLKIAEDFMKAIQPEKFKEVEKTAWSEPYKGPVEGDRRESSYTFTRKTNGIYFMENGFNLTVDNTTGTVVNYNFTWYNKPLPPADKVISPDQAHKALFDNVGIRLQYISVYPTETYGKFIPRETQKPEIKLVYALKPEKPANIDANTGRLLKYDGKPFEAGGVTHYADIKGHYAENQIKVLAEYGIRLPGSHLNPNQNTTRREFLYLLLKAVNPYIEMPFPESIQDDDKMYDALMAEGIVKEGEKAYKAPLTRQDAVKFIVRALRYDKVAEIRGIYTLPFKDGDRIKPDLYGYMAIAYGLKIIQGNNGYCNPTANLTRAQGFVLLYNFLNVE